MGLDQLFLNFSFRYVALGMILYLLFRNLVVVGVPRTFFSLEEGERVRLSSVAFQHGVVQFGLGLVEMNSELIVFPIGPYACIRREQ